MSDSDDSQFSDEVTTLLSYVLCFVWLFAIREVLNWYVQLSWRTPKFEGCAAREFKTQSCKHSSGFSVVNNLNG